MNKANLCWVFSDGRAGHDIQSLSLASNISHQSNLYVFNLLQPWKSFAPRLLPFFANAIKWKDIQPPANQSPQLIITCGRQAAAVGKYYTRQTHAKHLQILNPKDAPNHYDLIILPEHDTLEAQNVLKIQGSLHPINQQWLQQAKVKYSQLLAHIKKPILAVFIGDPGSTFYQRAIPFIQDLTKKYSDHSIYICGSRRTPHDIIESIRKNKLATIYCWFDEGDGINPYHALLAHANRFIVTADSINMVSEACSTDKPVSIVAKKQANTKQRKFIKSLQFRISTNDQSAAKTMTPLDEMQRLMAQKPLIRLLNDLKQIDD